MNTDPTNDAGNAPEPTPTQLDLAQDVADSHSLTADERAALSEAEDGGDAPAATTAKDDESPAPAATDDGAPAPDGDPAAARKPDEPAAAGDDGAAAAAAAADTPPPPAAEPAAPAPPTGPALLDVPAAPKDFETAFKDLDEKWDNGDLEQADYNKQYRDLTLEQARFESAKTAIEAANTERVNAFNAAQTDSFAKASVTWERANAEFMANPLRAQAMQQAIHAVDQQTGGTLAPDALFEQAQKIAFDAYNWTPKAPATPAEPADPAAAARARAAALANRQPDPSAVPPNPGNAPSTGVDNGSTSFADMDGADITAMERAVAGMGQKELDAFLREVDSPLPQS